MPKVSVIIPVYGVERYIERCARSLFEQSLDDIEYIFVDDCTPDHSIEILQKVIPDYPQRQTNIRIEKMPVNSGLAAVRRYGNKLAKGEYMIACDSDDYVESTMYEDMYNYAKLNDLDLVHCDIDVVNEKGLIRTITAPYKVYTSDTLKNGIIEGTISNSLCNKLVKREIYQCPEILYPMTNIDEDNVVAIQLAYYSTKLGYLNHSYYKAFQNSCSVSRVPGEEQILKRYKDSLTNSEVTLSFLIEKGYDKNSLPVIKAKTRPKTFLLPLLKDFRYYKLWKNTYPEINYRIIFNFKVPLGMRVKHMLALIRIYPLYRHFITK